MNSDLAEGLLFIYFYILKNRFIILVNPDSIYTSICQTDIQTATTATLDNNSVDSMQFHPVFPPQAILEEAFIYKI